MIEETFQELVIEAKTIHLGDHPEALEGKGKFEGAMYFNKFNLPGNLATEKEALLKCRTFNIQRENKRFILNSQELKGFLKKSEQLNEWSEQSTIIPSGLLHPGENSILISYQDIATDDFLIEKITLHFKVK